MDKGDSNGFFSRRLVCRSSDSSYNLTESSLIMVDYQQHFLACTFFVCITKLLIKHIRTRSCIPYPPENKPPSKIRPLPSLTLKFLHRYVCLNYKPPSHQVDCTRTHAREHVRMYVTPPFNWLRIQRGIDKPGLKTFYYDGTSSLAKTFMSRSRCFCFPLKTYTRSNNFFPYCRSYGLLPSTWQVISLPLFWRKKTKQKQQTLDISSGTWPTMVSSFHTATANGSWSLSLSHRGLIFEGKCIFENKPPPH